MLTKYFLSKAHFTHLISNEVGKMMCVTKINSTTQKNDLYFSKLWSPISMAVQVVQVRVWSPGAEIPIYNIVTHTWPSFLVSQASTTVYQKE